MTRNYLPYVVIILAVALLAITIQDWAWYVIDVLFIDDSDNPTIRGVPPLWPAHQ